MAQRHMDRLTSFDTSFLANEKANGHMAIGALLMCEGSAPDAEDFLVHIRSRVHQLPRLRQRLLYPPLGLGTPFWVDYPDFDVHQHVHRVTLSAPGTEAQFKELVGTLLAPPLDRAKPLWELILVEGFEDDRFAIVYKNPPRDGRRHLRRRHRDAPLRRRAEDRAGARGGALVTRPHALADRPARARGHRDRRDPGPSRPLAAARRGGSEAGAEACRGRSRRALGGDLEPGPAGAAGPFNTEIGPGRSFGWANFSLADFKHVKNALGGTVNDVTLAVAAGALRRWLLERELPVDGLELKALVPVSIRTENEHGELGNKLTAMRGPLPVGIEDPVARLRAVSVAMNALKDSKQPLGAEAIWGLNDWFRDFAPPVLLAPTAAINFSTRLFNLLVTNFPGPQIPFYVLGRELTAVYPVGFLAHRHALAIAILSYNGQVGFGLLADPDALPDADGLSAHLAASVEELKEAAAQVASPATNGDQLAADDRPRFARERERLGGA